MPTQPAAILAETTVRGTTAPGPSNPRGPPHWPGSRPECWPWCGSRARGPIYILVYIYIYIYIINPHMSPYGDCEVVQSKLRSSSANSNVFMYASTYVRTKVWLYAGERQRARETE